MVIPTKKTHKGKRVEIGTGSNRGLVFLIGKHGMSKAMTTDDAKKQGIVKASKTPQHKQTQSRKQDTLGDLMAQTARRAGFPW